MSKDKSVFDLEERFIDFAVRIIRAAESFSTLVTSIKPAKQKENMRTSSFEIPCSIFVIHYTFK